MALEFQSAFSIYKGVSQIGNGGAGTVWKTLDIDGNEHAVKYLASASVSVEKIKRFRNELAFCHRNQHRHIIKVLDWGYVVIDGMKCPFYVMRHYSSTLRRLLNQGIPKDKVLGYFSQLLDGVEAAHMQNVWHRDLKPENILFDPDSETLVVADFGIAHFSEDELQTMVDTGPHARLANFQYAAPEQRTRAGTVDHRADIYALGLILNEMFTGLLAHGVDFKRIAETAPDFSYLDEIVDAMLKQAPERRPQSIGEIKGLLIARGNDFISQQKLSALKQVVIPAGAPDDILITNPPELTGARWDNGNLYMTLSQQVNQLWAVCFKNPGSHTSIMGKGPSSFDIRGNTLKIHSDGSDTDRLISFTKEYVRMANVNYKNRVERELLEKQRAEKLKLKEQIALEEKARAINSKLKI